VQKDEILEFLGKIDSYLERNWGEGLGPAKLELRIFGKSALLLGGLKDAIGTTDIDLLRVESDVAASYPEIIASLEKEFGKTKLAINGYYLEFVKAAFVMLAPDPEWVPLDLKHQKLSAHYLEAHHVIGSKLFSAFADTPRKRDKQDIRAALDQGLVQWPRVSALADEIFSSYEFDARSDRFSKVFEYITDELVPDYGPAAIKFKS
jgi:hypothetical protein